MNAHPNENQKPSAEEAYENAHLKAQALVQQISELLFELPAPGDDDYPVDWGHVGTVNEVNRHLTEVFDFLAGTEELRLTPQLRTMSADPLGSVFKGRQNMNARNDGRMCGAVDQPLFEKVINDNLSPEAIATIIAFLQPAAFYKTDNADAEQALRQVEWFADTLTEMLGVEEHNRLMDKLGL